MLELQNVSFRYTPKGKNILSGFSASFGEGELVAITGRNGSGKTTMTRLLVGLEKPSEGKVIYNGKNITQEDASERSHFIGYVFQQPDRQMFMPTVREEVAFGPRMQGLTGKALDDAVENAMRAVDVQEEADRYPRSLPRGTQQRVAIASAIAMNIRYLILDEPTSGQDGNEKKRLVSLMNKLCSQGITVILVTHDMDIVASDCSRVIVIAEHEKAYDGTPERLFATEGMAEQWGLAVPSSVALGRALPGSPYCKDMVSFCNAYLKIQGRE